MTWESGKQRNNSSVGKDTNTGRKLTTQFFQWKFPTVSLNLDWLAGCLTVIRE